MKQLFAIAFWGLMSLPLYCQTPPVQAIREVNDLLYVGDSVVENEALQRLNLVLPEGSQNYPLLIWIGGGAWSYVDRNVEMDLARKFAQAGIGVASVGHRLSPAIWRDSSLNRGIQHPKHMEDIASATRWLQQHAEDYGYDTNQFFIGGFSSGAHLAALLCLDPAYLQAVGLSTSLFKGMIPISGAYDIVNYHEVFQNGSRPELARLHVEAVFGPTLADWQHASPTAYLQNLSIPMLLMSDRGLVGYTRILEERLLETEFRDFQVLYIHDLSHAELWRHISQRESSMYRQMMIDFMGAQIP